MAMQSNEPVVFERDCEAALIPAGDTGTLGAPNAAPSHAAAPLSECPAPDRRGDYDEDVLPWCTFARARYRSALLACSESGYSS